MAKCQLGVQLYSVRDNCAADLEGTLAAIARMGYEGVELAGTYDRTGADWDAMLKRNGLAAPSAHIGIDNFLPEKFQATMDLYGALGCKILIVPGLPHEYSATLDAFKRAAEVMNQAAEAGAKDGFSVGFHNHAGEFKPLDNGVPMDVLAQTMKPSLVLEFDMGWVYAAGVDGVAYLAKYPGRSPCVHLKPFSDANPSAALGADDVPWADVVKACVETGATKWFIVEHENYDAQPPMACIEEDLKFLKTIAP